jgi:hypothetical protein
MFSSFWCVPKEALRISYRFCLEASYISFVNTQACIFCCFAIALGAANGDKANAIAARRGGRDGVVRKNAPTAMALIVSMDGSITAVKADTGSKLWYY